MSEAQGADKKDAGAVRLFGHEVEKKKAVGAGIALVCVLALIVFCFVSCSSGGTQEEPVVEEDAQPEETADEATPAEAYVLAIAVEADGWDAETSSPVIVHIEGEGTDFYHAFDANDPDAVVGVGAAGEYKLTFISPINADGSIYKVPEAVTVSTSVEDGGAAAESMTFEKVEAADVTAEELDKVVEDVAEAVKKGDDTLTGDTGKEVVEKVEENAKANPNSDDAAIEDSAAAAEEAVGNTSAPDSDDSRSTDNLTNQTSSTSSQSSNSSSTSGGSTSTSNTSSSSHTHDYSIPITETVHHDAEYTTVHHDAVTHEETVYTTVHHDAVYKDTIVCNGCGAQFDTDYETEQHAEAQMLAGNFSCGAMHTVSTQIQAAYDEQVASGTTTVVDQEAYDEQVLVSEAWDETVITGYKCSCGAVQQ